MIRGHNLISSVRPIFVTTLLLVLVAATAVQANCPPLDSTVSGWAQNTTVYYDVSSLPSGIQSQAIAALNAWTSANELNGSGVAFYASSSSHPANLTVQIGSTSTGAPGQTNISPPTGTTTSASTTIDANNTNFYDPNQSGWSDVFLKVMLHEIGHTMGITDEPADMTQNCGGQQALESVMNGKCGINDSAGNMPNHITLCDQSSVASNSQYPLQPCPSNSCNEGGGGFDSDYCTYRGQGCPTGWHDAAGCCQPDVPSPIIIDLDGSGFQLTSAEEGVWFDFYSTGKKIKVAWTTPGSTNAWLVLDLNGNGNIDNAKEMFGNLTAQPPSSDRNGFLALAEFDKSGAGGNEDGEIDSRDAVFASLRIWIDRNHNGISEPSELFPLHRKKIDTIHLMYHESRRVDMYGNQFRYRAEVDDSKHAQIGRWAWDVFLVRGP